MGWRTVDYDVQSVTGRKEIGVFGVGKEKGLSRNPVDRQRVDGGRKNKRVRPKRSNRAA